MDLGLQGKSVVVLASSAGLGRGTALEFAREGARVMLFSRSEERLRAAREEIAAATGQEPAYTVGDVCRGEDIRRVIQAADEMFGGVDVLVNNSGGPPAGGFEQFDDGIWTQAFELTLLSFVRSIREVVPLMRRREGGRIVNLSSSSIRQVIDNLIMSNTFRMGVVGLTKTLSRELARDNILINVVGPGRIGTDRVEHLDRLRAEKSGLSLPELQAMASAEIPVGRYGTPDELARLVVFLASPANTYITGQSILVDGGMVRAY